jgi:hypothetical protein
MSSSSRKSGVAFTDDLPDWVTDRMLDEQQTGGAEDRLSRERGGARKGDDVIPDPPPRKPPEGQGSENQPLSSGISRSQLRVGPSNQRRG